MKANRDIWYIRLPSGQELKAKSTAAVSRRLQSGAIPKTSFARRSRRDEWRRLEWHSEFTNMLSGNGRRVGPSAEASRPSGIGSRLDPLRLRTAGVRGLLDDLIAALDSTFDRDKLVLAGAACVFIGVLWGILPQLFRDLIGMLDVAPTSSERLANSIPALISVIVLGYTIGLLARMTHIELSSLRPARWHEIRHRFPRLGLRLAIAYILILGCAGLAIIFAEWLPRILLDQSLQAHLNEPLAQAASAVAAALGVVIEAALVVLIGLSWMLAPLLVIEEVSLLQGIREWLALVREHGSRVLLAEFLTITLGLLVTLPIVGLAELILGRFPQLPEPIRFAAYGAAMAPFVAFMAVANVFIFLDVKYERT